MKNVKFKPTFYELPYSEFRVEIEIFELTDFVETPKKMRFMVNLSKINFTKQTQV